MSVYAGSSPVISPNLSKMEDEYYLRATGRSYRIANKIIDDLFVMSRGTYILVKDHYPTRAANVCLLQLVEKRLHNDFPYLEYKVVYKRNNIYLVRLTELERDKSRYILDDNIDEKRDAPYIFDDAKKRATEEWLAGMKRLWKKGLLHL